MAFLDVRFPDKLAYGSSGGGPTFNTTVVTTDSGGEQRNGKWAVARHMYDVSMDDTRESIDEVRSLFYVAMGKLHHFRFKDVDDYEAVDEPIGGSGATRQLVKTYTVLVGDYVRKISHPVQGTVTLKRNGANYATFTLDTSTGIVTLGGLTTGAFTWSGEFDIPVRFDIDSFAPTIADYDARKLSSIPLVEVIL